MIQIYKPNKKNTGSALSLSYNPDDQSLFGNFIKQASWDESTMRGSFGSNAKDPLKTIAFKLNTTEACGILNAIDGMAEYSTVHVYNGNTTRFKFAKASDGFQGFTFQVGSKNENGEQKSFFIPLNDAEARLIKEYLQLYLRESFMALNRSWKNKSRRTSDSLDQPKKQENSAREYLPTEEEVDQEQQALDDW